MEHAVLRRSAFISVIVTCLPILACCEFGFGQDFLEDATRESVRAPQIENPFSYGMAYQIDSAEFPAVDQILDVLESPNGNLEQAENLCRDALRDQPSDDGQLMLAAILSDRDHDDEALRLLTGIIDRDGSNWQALVARSQVRSKLQDFEGASADSEAAAGIMQMVMFHESDDESLDISLFDIFEVDEVDFFDFEILVPREPAMLAGMVAIFAISCFGLCLRWGLRQKNEANGTWWQLFGVSAYVTAIWTIPWAVAATMTGLDIGQLPGTVWWAFIGIFAFFFIRGTMKPPNLTYVGKEALPECDSPEMLARIAQLSKRIGVATPTVRTQRAMHHAGDSAAAFVGGLAPHSVVLYDTILSQLRDDEQDAIIGHELGHVANRSIWVYTAVFPLTTTAMVILSYLGGGFFGVMAGSALRAGAFRLMSRRFEYDCDRRAALATSPDSVSRALRRLYARHVLGKSGLLSDIVHSTATHPSLNERIHAMDMLAASGEAADDQSVTVPYDNDRVAFCRKSVVVFSILWLCLTAYGIAATLVNGDSLWPMLALFAAVFGPTFFIVLASRRALQITKARVKGRLRWSNLTLRRKLGTSSLFGCGIFILSVVLFDLDPPKVAVAVPNSDYEIAGPAIAVAVVLMFGTAILGFVDKPIDKHAGKKVKLNPLITAAVQRNDFDGVIEICRANYEIIKHDKHLKYSGAAALLATRQLEKFVPYCEQIRKEFPHFPPPAIALATTWLDQGEPAKALEAIRSIQMDLHKLDPMPATMSSRALLALGQLDEARTECERGSELAPDDVSTMAQAACVAMASGDLEEADRLIEQGNDLLPAEPLLIVARGERAILADDKTALQTERDAISAALEGDRLLCLYSILARFDEVLVSDSSDDA
jgi:Zn-dependent protease with chaperone function/Flp pilus assembly protein TadD